MKVYTRLPKKLMPYFKNELKYYSKNLEAGDLITAWSHLEKAHIIGQRFPFHHSLVHWKMLQFGFIIKSGKEIFGQIPRLIFGGIKSFVGTIPIGNPGGSNVPALKPFPIEPEIQEIFKKVGLALD